MLIIHDKLLKVIKSARVMKKAVAHLIPFMEEEQAIEVEGLKAQGLEITGEVRMCSRFGGL